MLDEVCLIAKLSEVMKLVMVNHRTYVFGFVCLLRCNSVLGDAMCFGVGLFL